MIRRRTGPRLKRCRPRCRMGYVCRDGRCEEIGLKDPFPPKKRRTRAVMVGRSLRRRTAPDGVPLMMRSMGLPMPGRGGDVVESAPAGRTIDVGQAAGGVLTRIARAVRDFLTARPIDVGARPSEVVENPRCRGGRCSL